jgi:hypothetical protein
VLSDDAFTGRKREAGQGSRRRSDDGRRTVISCRSPQWLRERRTATEQPIFYVIANHDPNEYR